MKTDEDFDTYYKLRTASNARVQCKVKGLEKSNDSTKVATVKKTN